MGRFRRSKRRAASFPSDLLNVPCSPSWTVKIQKRASQALKKPYQEVRDLLAKQSQLFIDESPTKQGRERAWTWMAVASKFAVFAIFLSRGRTRSKRCDYKKILINCHRAKMYTDGEILQGVALT